MKRNKVLGFTSIELLAVVAITGILTGVIIPNMKETVENYRLNIAALRLCQDILLIQQNTVSEKSLYKILFDLKDRNFYLIAKGYKSEKINLPSGVYIENVNFKYNTLSFYPTGAPTQGGTIVLKTRNKKLYVIVAVATGRVRISKIPPSSD